jgi:predicted ATPase
MMEEEQCTFLSCALSGKRLRFSRRLYGREHELERLVACFHNAAAIIVHGIAGHDGLYDEEGDDGARNPPSSFPVMFVSGHSGRGKSALVDEFRRRILAGKQPNHVYMTGKFAEMKTADPFRVIMDAIGGWCKSLDLMNSVERHKVTEEVRRKVEDSLGEDTHLLVELIPHLSRLLLGDDASTVHSTTLKGSRTKPTKLKIMFQSLFMALCSPDCPLILHLDDLQWADHASLELVAALLGDTRQANFMFVASFRSNEVPDDHFLRQLMNSLEESPSSRVFEHIELNDLTVTDLSDFICDSLELTLAAPEEVMEISRAIFDKTHGNVNYTMEAIEHLVRKEILYFEPRLGRWQWDVSPRDIEEAVSDNVMEMIQAKLTSLPDQLQQALLVASFIRNVIDVDTLLHAMGTVGLRVCKSELMTHLDQAVEEGLLAKTFLFSDEEYIFAHDSIQESSRRLVSGEEREHLSIRLGAALAERAGDEAGEDWMIFGAAHHWNYVQQSSPFWPSTEEDKIMVSTVNIKAAELCLRLAAFLEAISFLAAGIETLDAERRWTTFYDESMELHLLMMDAEYSAGNFEDLQGTIQEVLRHAQTDRDKGRAHIHSLGIIMQGKNRNHAQAIQKGLNILASMGVEIDVDPEDVQAEDIEREEQRRSLTLGRRKIADLIHGELMEDDTIIAVLEQVARASIYSGKLPFVYLLGQVAIQLCAKQGISEYLPRIYMYSQMYFRQVGLNMMAYDCAVTCKELVDRLEDCSIEGYCKVSVTCNNGLQLFRPCRLAVDVYEECYTMCVRAGDTEFASLVANSQGMCFFLSGIPITELAERNFEIFEEESRRFNQPPSVYMLFLIYRQLVLNLQGRSMNPVIFDGQAMTEKQILDEFSSDTPQYRQTLRDFSVCKLMAACIYGHLPTMDAMIKNLKTWPDFDVLLHRLHMRLVWVSLAAFALARETKSKEYVEMSRKYLQMYADLGKQGNPNAKVIFACLSAEHKQSKADYNRAIQACHDGGFLHLEALMNEHCGQYQLKRRKRAEADCYIVTAFRLYRQYGALGKCRQMQTVYGAVGTCDPVQMKGFVQIKEPDSNPPLTGSMMGFSKLSKLRSTSAGSITVASSVPCSLHDDDSSIALLTVFDD